METERRCTTRACYEVLERIKQSTRVQNILNTLAVKPVVSCSYCPERGARALIRATKPMQIVLCTNGLHEEDIEEAMVHELVHAYDYSKKRCDFKSCLGLAYSEVRAAREAECSGQFTSQWLKNQCIRDRAIKSTANMYPRSAAPCVDSVFDDAVKDLAPAPAAVEI